MKAFAAPAPPRRGLKRAPFYLGVGAKEQKVFSSIWLRAPRTWCKITHGGPADHLTQLQPYPFDPNNLKPACHFFPPAAICNLTVLPDPFSRDEPFAGSAPWVVDGARGDPVK